MDDAHLFIIAALVALCGILLLWSVAPPPSEGYVLEGTVASVRGSTVYVEALVPVQARGMHPGERFQRVVLWRDDRFFALASQNST